MGIVFVNREEAGTSVDYTDSCFIYHNRRAWEDPIYRRKLARKNGLKFGFVVKELK